MIRYLEGLSFGKVPQRDLEEGREYYMLTNNGKLAPVTLTRKSAKKGVLHQVTAHEGTSMPVYKTDQFFTKHIIPKENEEDNDDGL